tara:strand:- start:12253 stop:12957 length:705 start_codon:yes stop_codon:yes gene_type:complete
MELKINVAHKRTGNWEHIGNHLFNFYSKIGVIGQPKSNRNVYPNEYKELLKLSKIAYADVHDAYQQKSHVFNYDNGKPKKSVSELNYLNNKTRRKEWDAYTNQVITNTDDVIENPNFKDEHYSNDLADRMRKKLAVEVAEDYVSSAQLHMRDRFRKDIRNDFQPSAAISKEMLSDSDSDFEESEAKPRKKHKKGHGGKSKRQKKKKKGSSIMRDLGKMVGLGEEQVEEVEGVYA